MQVVETGVLIGGRFRLEARLGAGGMGEVWRARDEWLRRAVALKVLKSPGETGRWSPLEAAARFQQEALTAARLRSPHVVAVHDFGIEDPQGVRPRPYLVTELVEGRSLRQELAAARSAQDAGTQETATPALRGALPVRQAVLLASQLCAALEAAHAEGVVHRDIKPGNVMVGSDGAVRVLDFGIAKFLAVATAANCYLTGTGLAAPGTPGYMAPERFHGRSAEARGTEGRGADMYAVGCMLHEMLAGAPPFAGRSDAELMVQHLDRTPTPLGEIRDGLPVGLADLVARLLDKEPRQRPDAGQARRHLESLLPECPAAGAGEGEGRAVGDGPSPPAAGSLPLPSLPSLPPILRPADETNSAPGAGRSSAAAPAAPAAPAAAEPAAPSPGEAAPTIPPAPPTPPAPPPANAPRRPESHHHRRRLLAAGAASAVVALVIVLILWPDPSGQPAPNSARPVYSIAVIGDYGPEGKAVSTTAYNSVRLALRQASPQTAPYRVEVAKYSEPGTSRGLARLAGKLTADHRTVAVIGPVGRFESAVMEEASAIFDSHRMPLVSPKARLTGELSSTTFQLAGAAEAMERKTVAYLLSAANRPGGIHQILYVSDGEDWSVKRTGRMISETRDVRSGSMAVSEPDGRSAREVADHALGERFDAVYFTGESRDFEKLDAALDTAGYRGLRMVEEVSVRTDYQVRANWLATTDECGPLARFDDPYKKRFGHAAELGGAETYDAVNAVLAALGRTERRSVPAARSRISRQLDHGEAVHGLCRPDLRFGRDGRAIDAPLFVNQYFWGFSGVDKYQLIGEIGGRAMRDLDLGKLR